MIACVLTATLLGLFAGLAPGPATTMVAVTGLERGFRAALPVAAAPMLTDLAPMFVSTLVITRLDYDALTLLGLCGGVVVSMVGARLIRTSAATAQLIPDLDDQEGSEEVSVHVGHALATSAFNVAPWIFWFIVGSPLLLSHLAVSRTRGVIFVVVLFTVNASSALFLGWLASRAGSILEPRIRARVTTLAGLVLIGVGGTIVWQAMEGNFQALVAGNDALRERVGG